MSIIIKGLNMPKSCGKCEFNYYLEGGSYEWWECVILHDDINQFDTRRTDCPLIEIPTPHGRLIDADEYLKLLGNVGNREYRREKGTIQDAMKFLNEPYTPTIIEAER